MNQVSGNNSGITEWPGVERIYCPVFPEHAYDPVSMAARHSDYQKGTKDVGPFNRISSGIRRVTPILVNDERIPKYSDARKDSV